MKSKSLTYILATAAIGLATAVNLGAQGLNFASTPGSTIQFNGNQSTFGYSPSASSIFGGIFLGSNWEVGSENGGGTAAIGLLGTFNSGPFTIGTITTVVDGPNVDESAPVTGPGGVLSINDGSGFNLTGNVNWVDVATHNYAGGINSKLVVNVTDLSYGGSNADLAALSHAGSGQLDLTFQFAPGLSLADLTSGVGPYNTSFSGSLTVVPEPTSTACLLLGLGALMVARIVRQKKSA
jgi:hypothetical protein